MSEEKKAPEQLTVKETTLTGESITRRIAARITGIFDWAKTKNVAGSRGHIEVSQSYYCKCGKAVNVRDRRAKRYHSPKIKGHGPS